MTLGDVDAEDTIQRKKLKTNLTSGQCQELHNTWVILFPLLELFPDQFSALREIHMKQGIVFVVFSSM